MTNASDQLPTAVAIVFVAFGLAIAVAARPICYFQLRMLERQLAWYHRHTSVGVIMFRFFGGFFVLIGLATVFQH